MNVRPSTFAPLCLAALVTLAALPERPRAGGLREVWLDAGRWNGLALDRSALSNPAFLTHADFVSFRAVLSSLVEELYVHDLGATVPLGLRHAAGVTWMTLAADSSIPGRAPETEAIDRERFELVGDLFAFSYGVRPWRSLRLGINLNIARQRLEGSKRYTGFGVDLGAGYDLPEHPVLGGHAPAIAVQNLVAPYVGPEGRLRRTGRVSLLSRFRGETIESFLEIAIEEPFGGAEADGERGWAFSGRIGYRSRSHVNVHLLAGADPEGLTHVGVAAGLTLSSYVYDKPRDLVLEYQHSWKNKTEESGPSIHLAVEIGDHRLTADLLLRQARELYGNEAYWKALLTFGRVIAEYPNYRRNDVASCSMAQCELALGMHAAAAARFSRLPRHYPRSDMIPAAALGLMRVHYREGRYDSVAVAYERLRGLVAPDSLRHHARYLMAQAHLRHGRHAEAGALLKEVPRSHPDYLYARHSLAIVDIGVGRPDEALERLRGCLRFSPRTAGERELINRCRVLLGYLHYERSATADSALAKATLVLRKVPRRSIYFEDALLGLAWTSLKARQWEDCIVAAEALTKSPRTVLRAEGLLLIAYTHYARERYAEAVEVLEEAERAVEDAAEHGPVEDEASSTPFDPLDSLGMTVDRLARKRRRPSVRREITQLAEEHREMHRALEKRLSLAVDAARDRSFVRRLPTLRDDIQYSLAAATYMLHAEGGAPQAGPGKKQKRLDKKIEALERKVRELESGP